MVARHQPFFFSENKDKCSLVWYKNLDRSFFHFVRDHACDGQTDRRTDRRTNRILLAIPRLHYMQRGKNCILSPPNRPNFWRANSIWPTIESPNKCSVFAVYGLLARSNRVTVMRLNSVSPLLSFGHHPFCVMMYASSA